MPNPQPPVLLYDNVFNRVRQYQSATLAAISTATGTDVRGLSSGRRERASWQAAAASAFSYVSSDLGAGVAKVVDSVWIDRGHNLWGLNVEVLADDGAGGSQVNTAHLQVPALNGDGSFTPGGDPTTGMAVTEEGALYAFFPALAARRRFFVYIVENAQPRLTGVILGQRVQLPIFSTTMDEDAGALAGIANDESDTGLLASSRGYDYRTLQLTYANIGSTTYDNTVRQMRELIFARKQCCFIATNYGTYPARGWLYKHAGTTWSAPTSGVLRRTAIPFREVGAQIK